MRCEMKFGIRSQLAHMRQLVAEATTEVAEAAAEATGQYNR